MRAEDPRQADLAARRAAVAAKPASWVAEHNLAALLGDMGFAGDAEGAARRSFAKGGDAPETCLVLGRALLAQGRYDEADGAFGEALKRRPAYGDAVRERAQLIWMQTGNRDAALGPIDAAIAAAPEAGGLIVIRAQMMDYAGDRPEAILDVLTRAGAANDPAVELAAVDAALKIDKDLALVHARAALALAPQNPQAAMKLAETHLCRNEPAAALALLDRVLAARPDDQGALALQATGWWLAGDPRALRPEQYPSLVGGYTIDTPTGWPTLRAWLDDLAVALRGLHGLTTHPVGQSLRHGTQTTTNLLVSEDPAVKGFFAAVDRPIREHIAALGSGDDPTRRRISGGYRISGCWSVQLRPGGFHAAHVHPEGWLSSACYIELPPAVDAGGKQGWIGFGAPPFDCGRPLPPEHYEKPAPGRLVLFPSWMWHGTIPFDGPSTRLTVAFDVVPA